MGENLTDYVLEQYNTIIENRFRRDKIFDLMEIDTESAQKIVKDSIIKNREDLFNAVTQKLNDHYDMIQKKDYYKIISDENSSLSIFRKIRANMLLEDFSMFPLLELGTD